MKIIYITNARIPTEKVHGFQICKMCEELGRQGAEILLIVPARVNTIKEDLFEHYQLEKCFSIKYVKTLDLARYGKYLGKFGFYLHSLLFLIKLIIVRIDKEAVIYTRNAEIAWLFNKKGYKTVYEIHSWPESMQALNRKLLKKVDLFVAITNSLKTILTGGGIPAEKILVAPDGVNLKIFDINLSRAAARNKLNWPPGKKIIVYEGHLYDWKGAQTIAEAAGLFDNDHLFIFIGGTDEDIIKFKNKNTNKNILIAGRQPHHEIPVFLKAADVLVLPNSSKNKISKFYTSPLKLFEYMASRRPIIASDLPSLREILNEQNAVFFRPDDPADLKEKIGQLLTDQAKMEKISAQALVDVKKYAWDARAINILNFIR